MRARAVLLIGVLAGGVSIGCDVDRVTAPTLIGFSDSAAPPPPGSLGSTRSRRRPPVSGTCDSSRAQFAVGQRAGDDLLARARAAAGAGSARFLRPNQPITTEFLATRLNLHLDRQEIVRSVSCG